MQTWENGKNPNFEHNFGPAIFFVSFTSTSSTFFQAIILCQIKEN